MPSRRLIALFLTLCLLVAQQAGYAHAYTHDASSPHGAACQIEGDGKAGGDGSLGHPCLDCLAFAAFHAFAHSATVVPGGAAWCGFVPPAVPEGIVKLRPGDCRTRAPPLSPEA